MPPRKRRQITTILPMPPPLYDKLDRMLKLIMRLFRGGETDIFHMIWGDVMSAIFNRERVLRYVPDLGKQVPRYVPRHLLQWNDDPELALLPPLQTVPWNP